MQIILRCVLDVEEDVIRDISISDDKTLENLHHEIISSFMLKPGEMAAFYKTNEVWEQGEEIPLIDMSDIGESSVMHKVNISEIFTDKTSKLIYLYDFMNLWTFYVMVHDVKPDITESTQTILSVGAMPKEAETKQFKAESTGEDLLNDEFDDDYDDFGPFDEDYSDFL